MAKEITFKGRLVTDKCDWMGYTTYVFENLEPESEESHFIMCTRFPNWNHGSVHIGEVGFVTARYVIGGVDTWFDGSINVPYRNTDVHFLKFVPEATPTDVKLTL